MSSTSFPPPTSPPSNPHAGRRPILLLVEDNPDDEALALRALARGGWREQIIVRRDGEAALDYLRTHAGADRPAVVFLDLKLPKLDGLEVLRALRADPRTRSQPVVVLTSSREEQDVIAGYDLGTNSYVHKPIDFEVFSETIRQVSTYWLSLNERLPR